MYTEQEVNLGIVYTQELWLQVQKEKGNKSALQSFNYNIMVQMEDTEATLLKKGVQPETVYYGGLQ
jgi:hypothetical protein